MVPFLGQTGQSSSCSRELASHSRCFVQEGCHYKDIMLSTSFHLRKDLLHMVLPKGRPVCNINEQRIRALHSPIPDPKAWAVDALCHGLCLEGYAYCPVAILASWFRNAHSSMQIMVDLSTTSLPSPLEVVIESTTQPRLHNNLEFLNLHVWLLDSMTRSRLGYSLRCKIELGNLSELQGGKSTWLDGPF